MSLSDQVAPDCRHPKPDRLALYLGKNAKNEGMVQVSRIYTLRSSS